MIRLIKHWTLYYVDEYRNSKCAKFQTWLNETTGKKEYWLFKPPKNTKQIVTKEIGNKYYKYLIKKYKVRLVKVL